MLVLFHVFTLPPAGGERGKEDKHERERGGGGRDRERERGRQSDRDGRRGNTNSLGYN
jgi:hypothetical protein